MATTIRGSIVLTIADGGGACRISTVTTDMGGIVTRIEIGEMRGRVIMIGEAISAERRMIGIAEEGIPTDHREMVGLRVGDWVETLGVGEVGMRVVSSLKGGEA